MNTSTNTASTSDWVQQSKNLTLRSYVESSGTVVDLVPSDAIAQGRLDIYSESMDKETVKRLRRYQGT